jgi:hypothetical protein
VTDLAEQAAIALPPPRAKRSIAPGSLHEENMEG